MELGIARVQVRSFGSGVTSAKVRAQAKGTKLGAASGARPTGRAEGESGGTEPANTSRVRRFLSSLSSQIAATLAVVLAGILALFALWAATTLRGDLFESRRDAILEDASVRFSQAQSALDQSTATTVDEVQELASQVLNSIRESAAGAGAVSVMLLRSPEASETFRINEYFSTETLSEIPEELRANLAFDTGWWQSVSFSDGGNSVPGLLVGALVDLPAAGPYELFILYSLQTEQSAVATVMSVLFVGFIPILLVTVGLTFILVYRMLRPVRAASLAAARLAEGDLESRVEEQGRNEMAALGRAFNEMAQSLEKQINDYDALSKLQQGFVSDVSHELRTPMTTIRMAEDIIYEDRDALPPASKRSAELLHSEAARFEEMLADLLEISRYDAQSAKLHGEPTDLYALVAKTIEANRELADRMGVEVVLSPRPKRPSVPVDAKRLERVVRNLLVNAFEYSEGKPVEVTVESGETSVALRVRDYGAGMSRETVKRVFDRFYRANPSRTRTTGGTGLGLAIAKEDVALHNGVINVWGEPGEGASFVVTLPRESLSAVTEFPLKVWEQE